MTSLPGGPSREGSAHPEAVARCLVWATEQQFCVWGPGEAAPGIQPGVGGLGRAAAWGPAEPQQGVGREDLMLPEKEAAFCWRTS